MDATEYTVIFQTQSSEPGIVSTMLPADSTASAIELDEIQQIKAECSEIEELLQFSEQVSTPSFWYYSST